LGGVPLESRPLCIIPLTEVIRAGAKQAAWRGGSSWSVGVHCWAYSPSGQKELPAFGAAWFFAWALCDDGNRCGACCDAARARPRVEPWWNEDQVPLYLRKARSVEEFEPWLCTSRAFRRAISARRCPRLLGPLHKVCHHRPSTVWRRHGGRSTKLVGPQGEYTPKNPVFRGAQLQTVAW